MKNNKIIRFLSFLLVVLIIFFPAANANISFAAENPNSGNAVIKNIIVMIPDGGGFGNFDIADALKLSGNKIPNLTTPVTTDAISGMTANGLYLSSFLIGTSITRSASNAVTDSAAGGTAIATGYKTKNGAIAITPDAKGTPIASLLEACQIAGKSTGLVATKFWFDATPASFASHATSRKNYDQITSQMLNHNLDVLLGGGNGWSYDKKINPAKLGYTVVRDKTSLFNAAKNGATKVWSSFNSGSTSNLVMDYQNRTRPAHPTLLDMTKASIDILSKNINNPNGFFLMIEGSQVDTGGHNSNAVQTVSEYLAFDEAFAYVVEWAKNDGHTLVVGVPDHDTGGFTPNEEETALIQLSKGISPTDSIWAGQGKHTGQNVPIWAYAPEGILNTLLQEMGLPSGESAEKARTGKYHRWVRFDSNYAVQNTALAHAVAAVSGIDLDAATKELFVDVTDIGTFNTGSFTANTSGITVPENANYYFLKDGTRVDFIYGVSVYTGNRFYVPKHVAERMESYPWENPFADVSETDPFYDAVEFVSTNKLFLGTDKGFEPHIPMTRAMYVTVLGRLTKADVSAFKTSTFPDVKEGIWYTEFVGWAHTNKIVLGDNLGNFMPNNNITREQMMMVIYNYARYLGKDTSTTAELTYADIGDIHDWAKDAVAYCFAHKLVSANENNKIRPTETATRAEVAELMMNFATKILG